MKKLMVGVVGITLLASSIAAFSMHHGKAMKTANGGNVYTGSQFGLYNNSSPATTFFVSTWNFVVGGENDGQTAGFADYFSLPNQKKYMGPLRAR